MTETPEARRLFLALWPDDRLRKTLRDMQHECLTNGRIRHARRVPRQNLHMTLHFLGRVEESARLCIVEALSGLRVPSFRLQLDVIGMFRRAGIVWMGPSHVPEELDDLVTLSAERIRSVFALEQDKRHVPHVTLFRKARQPCGIEIERPVEWDVQAYELVESVTYETGPEYRVLHRWDLGVCRE